MMVFKPAVKDENRQERRITVEVDKKINLLTTSPNAACSSTAIAKERIYEEHCDVCGRMNRIEHHYCKSCHRRAEEQKDLIEQLKHKFKLKYLEEEIYWLKYSKQDHSQQGYV